MALSIHQLPALADNYIYILRDSSTATTGVVDPSEAKGVLDLLRRESWDLDFVFNTHHHWDHVGGNEELKRATGAHILCSDYDKGRIAGADEGLKDQQVVKFGGTTFRVLQIPGHTLGHIALWFENEKALFCGDTLFGSGCGRLFEGSPAQMFKSLHVLAELPADTRVFCGHEYTLKNCEFALTLEPEDLDLKNYAEQIRQLREQNKATVPTVISDELRFNPFVRAKDLETFTQIRRAKDKY